MDKIKKLFSNLRLRQIINDLKRRPEDAAKDLKLSDKSFKDYLNGKKNIDNKFLVKALSVWPIQLEELINPYFKKTSISKIMRFSKSEETKRIMKRGNNDYYEYRDTVMDRNAPFRPEWIRQLCHVKDNKPSNKSLRWNKGHLLHQYTYFIGKVNFYYIDQNNNKKVSVMNTGDSMYIAPYIPHTFASRDIDCKGYIIAITFSDEISNKLQNYLINFKAYEIKKIIFKNKNKPINLPRVVVTKASYKKNIFKKNKNLLIKKLADNKITPTAKFREIQVISNNEIKFNEFYHQYLYVLSNQATIKIENKIHKLKIGDTIYLRPFVEHVYPVKGTKILNAKVQSILKKSALEQMSHLGKKNFNRLLGENNQWF